MSRYEVPDAELEPPEEPESREERDTRCFDLWRLRKAVEQAEEEAEKEIKVKRLTLDETWVEQLKMSGWIVEEAGMSDLSVEKLEEQWLVEHHFNPNDIQAHCFFCEYNDSKDECGHCPGREVDKDFDCRNPEYHYYQEPVKFLKKLVRLNKIRKKRSKK